MWHHSYCTDSYGYWNSYLYFGLGTGPIFQTNVQCTGQETFLLDCGYNQDEIGNFLSCYHYEAVGVDCSCKFLHIAGPGICMWNYT